MRYYVGVDVGSQSVRASLVDPDGAVMRTAVNPIKIWSPLDNYYQQSGEDIWNACALSCKKIVKDLGHMDTIGGMGFVATCSLVVLDKDHKPLAVFPKGDPHQNVVMWMDHRAKEQADYINKLKNPALAHVGGKISLEMQPPKILWLKQNMPDNWWQSTGYFMDLPDFLVWRATHSSARSLCSLVCKWMYHSSNNKSGSGWDHSFWQDLGLGDLLQHDCIRLGSKVLEPGVSVGVLTNDTSKQLGMPPKTPVAASMIDAHAGALALLSCNTGLAKKEVVVGKLALICGTSSCHIVVTEEPAFVNGVWGPYFSVTVPQYWTNEAGQTATGKLLDHVVQTHSVYPRLLERMQTHENVIEELNCILKSTAREQNLPSTAFLTKDLHVWPDFYGNRSPVADPTLCGALCGLTLSVTEKDLAVLYLATIQALAYGTKHIVSAMEDAGTRLDCVLLCGGLSKNKVFVQTHADALGLPVILPREKESVLLGAAMLGARASGNFPNLSVVMAAMGGTGEIWMPGEEDVTFHEKKYSVFLKMLDHQSEYKSIMKTVPVGGS